MDTLVDLPWNGIAAAAAFVAITMQVVIQRDNVHVLGKRIFVIVLSAMVGIAVMAVGPQMQNVAYGTFKSGFSSAFGELTEALTERGLEVVSEGIVFGLFPGAVTAMAALSGRSQAQRTKRAIVAAIASLLIYDMLSFAIAGWEQGTLDVDVFVIVSDIVGGAIAGIVTSLVVGLIVFLFDGE